MIKSISHDLSLIVWSRFDMPISAPPELDTMGATSVVVIVILFCYLMDLDGHGG
jgi:hypothetical protein